MGIGFFDILYSIPKGGMMKKILVLVVLIFVLSACSGPAPVATAMVVPTVEPMVPTMEPTVEVEISKSPCDKVMTTDQFFQDYLGQIASFEGSYQNSSVYAFRVGENLICTHHVGGLNSSYEELILVQDTVDSNGNADWTINPINDDSFNGLINFRGTVTNDVKSPDIALGNWILHNEEAILLTERPEDCILVNDETVKEFSGKTVQLIYVNDYWADDDSWRKIAFTYGDKKYCYDTAEYEYHITITDITGTAALADDPSWQGNTWFMQGMPTTFSFRSASFVNPQTNMTFTKDVLEMQVGKAVENREFGDPMVLEFMSHGGYYNDVIGWLFGGKYLMVYDTGPFDKVNSGYFVSPKEYVYGGELQVGTEIGVVGGFPLVVTALYCDPNKNFIQANYYWMDNGDGTSSWDISSSVMTGKDTNLYLMEGSGEGQTITYFHAPAECSH